MARYFTRTPERMDWDDAYPLLPSISVPEHIPTNTGLLDARGDEIWRAPLPVGFGRMEEWG